MAQAVAPRSAVPVVQTIGSASSPSGISILAGRIRRLAANQSSEVVEESNREVKAVLILGRNFAAKPAAIRVVRILQVGIYLFWCWLLGRTHGIMVVGGDRKSVV